MDAKVSAILELVPLQIEAARLLVQAGMERTTRDYGKAHAAYQEGIARSRVHLQAVVEFNTRFPESPYDILPIAQTLVSALMVDADIAHALGDREAADALRREALELSRTHLDRKATAEREAWPILQVGRIAHAASGLAPAASTESSQGRRLRRLSRYRQDAKPHGDGAVGDGD